MARTQVTALPAPLHADRLGDLAVDHAVDSAVDSHLSPGDNPRLLVDFMDNTKNLEITGQKALRQFPRGEYKFIHR